VTRRALAPIRTLGKLSIVRIGLVAIHALGEDQWPFEVTASMALRAIHSGMLAFKRKLGLGVIEAFSHHLQRDLLPTICVMAGLAALRETAMVRVLVAI